MIKTILRFTKGSPYKMIFIIFGIITLISSIFFTGKAAGYNKAKAEQLDVVKAAEKELIKKYDKIIIRKTRERNRAIRSLQRYRNKPEITYNEIREAATASTCKHLGIEFNRVFNKLVDKPPISEP